ncbi:hypothetical protein O181_080207, partial [Austropuccinia psidii MF-1]|nr:hypothetical protein [Austropuccinia psidii MF-1]
MWSEGILQTHFVNCWHFSFSKSQENYNSSNNESPQASNSNDVIEIDEPLNKISGLSSKQLTKISILLKEVALPSGITRVPPRIGTFKGGKIKASEWQSLFSIYLPLVFLDVFIEDVEQYESNSPINQLLLKNICALITCTNILISKSITEADANLFLQRYKSYCQTSHELFLCCKMNPNHHYALHVKSQLLWWGPLNAISENLGEQLNGFLQALQHNGKT